MRWLKRWSRNLWGLFPLTLPGSLLLALSLYLYWIYGQEQADFFLLAASLFLLAVLALSSLTLLIALSRLLLYLRRRPPELERGAEVGISIETGAEFPSFESWPLIQLRLSWDEPRQVELSLEGGRERVICKERGRWTLIRRRLSLEDIFGLCAFSFPRSQEVNLRVAPASQEMSMQVSLRHSSGEGYSHPAGELVGERVEMRRYAAGDPLRFLLWKTYARSRKLLVRSPERAISPQPSTVAFFIAGAEDEPSASTARAFLDQGLLGEDYLFSADGGEALAQEREAAVDQIIDSVKHRARGGEELGRLLSEVDPGQLQNCVFFLPSKPGVWMNRLLRFAGSLPVPPTLVLTVDGRLEQDERGRLGRWLFQPPERDPSMARLPKLYDELRRIGGPVRIIHRSSGRLMEAADVEALRAL